MTRNELSRCKTYFSNSVILKRMTFDIQKCITPRTIIISPSQDMPPVVSQISQNFQMETLQANHQINSIGN